MPKLHDILQDKIALDIECIDHVLLNGYIPNLQLPGGLVYFIQNQFDWPIPSPKAMYKISDRFRKDVDQFAKQQGLKIYLFKKTDDKAEIAQQHAENFNKEHGIVLIGKAQEKTNAYGSKRQDKGNRIWFQYFRRTVNVTHYYFYILDRNFGLIFIKICTYLPFEVKVCFNGHEWAKQQLRNEGINFKPLSNGFFTCEDSTYLQNICYQLDESKIQTLFDQWVEQLPWPITPDQRQAGYKHQLSVWQMEVSRTQVFSDPEQGRALVENLICENLDLGRPDRISLIFDRKVTKATPSEFHTKVIREGVLPCIRVRYKHSALKQYFKDGWALRTETIINNPYDFGFKRSLSQFTKLFQFGLQINNRLLEQEQLSQDCYVSLDEVRHLTQSTVLEDGQRASSLRFGDIRVMALFAATINHAYIPGEMRNKTLRQTVAQLMGVSKEDYKCSQMSYDLRRLRLKGLIEHIPNSHRYRLTELGIKSATFFVKLYERLFRPGISALIPCQKFPSDLAKALVDVAKIIDTWTNKAFKPNLLTI
jgi:hypothetical protein